MDGKLALQMTKSCLNNSDWATCHQPAIFICKRMYRKRSYAMKRIYFFAFCATVAAAADPLTPMQKMRVTGDRVNLRSRPSLTGELAGQVRQGDELNAYPVSSETAREWRAVEAPEWVECWVRGNYLEGNEVVPETLNVRAGPSLNYGVIATVKRGDRVTIKATESEWTQITPPPGSAVWISTAYVEPVSIPTPQASSALEGTTAVQNPETPDETAEASSPATEQPAADVVDIPAPKKIAENPPPTPEEMLEQIVAANSVPETIEKESAALLPTSFELDTAYPQGTAFSAEGMLRKTDSPLLHRLTDKAGKTVCFVRGNQEQMTTLTGRQMRMTGRSYSLREAQTPVLVPERILLQPTH
jgi:SH3-like domain-containing protein